MDKNKAIELLKQALTEIPHLRELHHDNQEFKLWYDKVRDIIKAALAPDDLTRFSSNRAIPYMGSDDIYQEAYLGRLTDYETALNSIIQKYEMLGIEAESATMAELPPKAFIAHGGESEARDKLCQFLTALGVIPIIVEEQPSEGRSVGENVDHYARQADCAIILATKGDIDGKTGKFIPRGNVLIEIGKAQELFKDRIIYLLQAGAKFPTDISEKVRERFTSENMDKAFIKIAKELKKFGILRAVKPQAEEQT
jgi:predicted nucleotide-binding protein